MFFINPPFGNYFNLPYTMSIKGSYTLYPRPGLIGQILKTLRYDFDEGIWINKIGLRNKGLDYAIENYKKNREIVSIAILDPREIKYIYNKIPEDMDIELNVSCPNAEKSMVSKGLSIFSNYKRKWCIIKLGPLSSGELIDSYYKQGFRQFHCSNTLPSERGGKSGHVLKPYNEKLIKYINETYDDKCLIIAGGGIQNYDDVSYYKNLGVNHYGFSSVMFNPIKFLNLYLNIIRNS